MKLALYLGIKGQLSGFVVPRKNAPKFLHPQLRWQIQQFRGINNWAATTFLFGFLCSANYGHKKMQAQFLWVWFYLQKDLLVLYCLSLVCLNKATYLKDQRRSAPGTPRPTVDWQLFQAFENCIKCSTIYPFKIKINAHHCNICT